MKGQNLGDITSVFCFLEILHGDQSQAAGALWCHTNSYILDNIGYKIIKCTHTHTKTFSKFDKSVYLAKNFNLKILAGSYILKDYTLVILTVSTPTF